MKLTIGDDALKWVGGIMILAAVAAVFGGIVLLAHAALS